MGSEPNQTSKNLPSEIVADLPDKNEELILRLGAILPWVMSAVLHLGLLMILFFVVATLVRDVGPRPDIDVMIPSVTLSEKPNISHDPFGLRDDTIICIYPDKIPPDKIPPLPQWDSPYKLVSPPFGQPRNSFGDTGRKARGSFFGMGGNARNICYVIDRSGSMLETFDYVKAEMIRSIDSLNPTQKFHVIFWSAGAPVENPPKKLIPAIAVNKQHVADFLRDVVPEGPTNPIKAMERAFQVTDDKGGKTQLIYLLTDGEFPADCVQRIRQLNADKKVKINTIAFISDTGRAQLEEIARDSGGKFTFVPLDMIGN